MNSFFLLVIFVANIILQTNDIGQASVTESWFAWLFCKHNSISRRESQIIPSQSSISPLSSNLVQNSPGMQFIVIDQLETKQICVQFPFQITKSTKSLCCFTSKNHNWLYCKTEHKVDWKLIVNFLKERPDKIQHCTMTHLKHIWKHQILQSRSFKQCVHLHIIMKM